MGPELSRSVKIWLNARADKEERVKGSERMTAVKLRCYASRKVATTLPTQGSQGQRNTAQPVSVFLVGDAAYGVPFFRSLNNGILSGTKLAETLNDLVAPKIEGKSYDRREKIESALCE